VKSIGYIGTAASLLLVLALQKFEPDEFTRILSWGIPSAVSLVSWIISLVFRAKQLRDLVKADIAEMISKQLTEQLRTLETEIDRKIEAMPAEAVDEVWHRLDTIMKLKSIGESISTTDEDPKPQS
jgi:hypothetical protein